MTGVAVGVSPGLGRSVGRYIPQAFGADSLLERSGFELLVPHLIMLRKTGLSKTDQCMT
jgi:hypothetical protein